MNKMTAISYIRNFALVSLASLALAGCFEQKPLEETKSVEFYSQNSADRAAMVKRCADNPGELKETPNCVNAMQAEKAATSGSLKKLNNW